MTSSTSRARAQGASTTGASGAAAQTSGSPAAACGAGAATAPSSTTSSKQASRRPRSSGSNSAAEAAAAAAAAGPSPHQPRRRRLTSSPSSTTTFALAATAAAAALLLLVAPRAALAIPPDYDPLAQNRTCSYVARGVKASVFFKGGPTAGQVRDLVDADPNGPAAKAATATSAEASSGGVTDSSALFPLDPGTPAFASNRSATAATACFGPGEAYDPALVAAGTKHNCRWRWSPRTNGGSSTSSLSSQQQQQQQQSADDPNDALVDFEEEQACLPVLTSNCYCYSVGRVVGSYCDPGLAGLGEGVSFPIDDCSPVVKGVVADGGKPVPSEEIREVQAGLRRPPAKGHYIGLAVMPSWEDNFNTGGDFHFWRMDSSLSWSYKAGDTFVRHTLFPGMGPPSDDALGAGNATGLSPAAASSAPKTKNARNSGFGLVQAAPALRDLEDPAARGPYTKFCGYFHVDPKTHRLGAGSGYSYSDVPVRYSLWQSATAGGLLGPEASVSVIPRDAGPSESWLGQYRKDYVDLGWCDADSSKSGGDAKGAARESGSRGGGGSGYALGDAKRTRSAVPSAARERGRRGLVARPAL